MLFNDVSVVSVTVATVNRVAFVAADIVVVIIISLYHCIKQRILCLALSLFLLLLYCLYV